MFKILPKGTPCSRNLINLALQEKWCDITERFADGSGRYHKGRSFGCEYGPYQGNV